MLGRIGGPATAPYRKTSRGDGEASQRDPPRALEPPFALLTPHPLPPSRSAQPVGQTEFARIPYRPSSRASTLVAIHQTGLRSAVRIMVGQWGKRRRRGHRDDRPTIALGDHQPCRPAAASSAGARRLTAIVSSNFCGSISVTGWGMGYARVVDEDVQTGRMFRWPAGPDPSARRATARSTVAVLTLQPYSCVSADSAALSSARVAPAEHEAGACGGEGPGDVGADAPGGSGDQGTLARLGPQRNQRVWGRESFSLGRKTSSRRLCFRLVTVRQHRAVKDGTRGSPGR